jgi:hypothetical protein
MGVKIPRLRFGIFNESNWIQSEQMNQLVLGLPKPQKLKEAKTISNSTKINVEIKSKDILTITIPLTAYQQPANNAN